MFAPPFAIPFRRHHDWQPVFMLFGIVRMAKGQSVHTEICRRVRCRCSLRLRQWVCTPPATPEFWL